MSVPLPAFRYHPEPLRSGSVAYSQATCRVCRQARGTIYIGPAYSEHDDLDDALCPWCIADGSAHAAFDVTFVDSEAFLGDLPQAVVDEITQRTPGYATWQQERWPVCCDDATAFLTPIGINELRATHRELEFVVLNHILYDLGISGAAATRMLDALQRDHSPTAYLFVCLRCGQHHVQVDHA